MISTKGNKVLQEVLDDLDKGDFNPEVIAVRLKEVRNIALKEKDPLLSRAMRLTYEHLEDADDFELEVSDEEDEEREEMSPSENLAYMIQLWIQSDNKYNRDEIREFADKLTEMV